MTNLSTLKRLQTDIYEWFCVVDFEEKKEDEPFQISLA